MQNWMRKIPHPTYGNYGGRNKRCTGDSCPAPVDGMDALFCQHDLDLQEAEKFERDIPRLREKFPFKPEKFFKNRVKEMRKEADRVLGEGLKHFKGPYARPVYGRMYRKLAGVIF